MNKERVARIVKILDEKKAENIEQFDLSGGDYFVDYVIVATTLGEKHGYALLDYLKKELKPAGEEFLNIEESDDWIVVDLGDIFIHLHSEYYRQKFNLDEFLENIKEKR